MNDIVDFVALLAAIDMPEELPAALGASSMIGQCFRLDRRREVPPVLAFFDGLTNALGAEHGRTASALH